MDNYVVVDFAGVFIWRGRISPAEKWTQDLAEACVYIDYDLALADARLCRGTVRRLALEFVD
ncbi:MAG TPA: hypothetical protein VIL78_00715 [Hanamia sp.]